MAALARACMIAVPGNSASDDEVPVEDPVPDAGNAIVPAVTDDSDSDDDFECLKRIQSLYTPLATLPPLPPAVSDDDDDVDDLETVRAIMRRFSAYSEGICLFICVSLFRFVNFDIRL